MCSGTIIGRLTPPFFFAPCRIYVVYVPYTYCIPNVYDCYTITIRYPMTHSIIRYPRTIGESNESDESTNRPIRCRTTYRAIEPIGRIRTTERTNHLIERTNWCISTIEPIDDRPSYLYPIERVNR